MVRWLMHKLDQSADLDPLLEQIGDKKYVLLGEASHGTSEFYAWRAEITKRLITEKGFSFVAVEGDWPDCYKVNRYIKGFQNSGSSANNTLHQSFKRWPTWMWANREMVDLVEWLKSYNNNNRQKEKVGFYGLDVYSLWESMETVIQYLQKNYPDAVQIALKAYKCFEPFGKDVEEYARATAFIPESCEDEVLKMLTDLQNRKEKYKYDKSESYFDAEQNAIVAKNAEIYYRALMHGGSVSWNIRDHHMAETLQHLVKFHGKGAKSIIWAHNTHIGDARATSMTRAGMVNIGQLVREQAGTKNVVLVGFGTHRGSVIAAQEWGKPMERMPVPPAAEGSWDDLVWRLGDKSKLLIFPDASVPAVIMGQRAIGVVYNPGYEKYGNYVDTVLPSRYDAFIHIDETHALHPLHMPVSPDEELPETFPSGL
jgi:erythromycin esterase